MLHKKKPYSGTRVRSEGFSKVLSLNRVRTGGHVYSAVVSLDSHFLDWVNL